MSKANVVTGSIGEGGSTICTRATRKINLRFLQTLSLLDVRYLEEFEGIRVTSRHKQEFENFFLLVATRNLDRRSFGHESRLIRPCPNAAESETV